MREIRQSGLEGGVAFRAIPTPIAIVGIPLGRGHLGFQVYFRTFKS